jgi:hypothetical protein
MAVSVTVGQQEKRVMVFGRRYAEWGSDGSIRFTQPEPFEQMPLLYQNAYGGFDGRVPVPEAMRATYETMARVGQVYDHPGRRLDAGDGSAANQEPPSDEQSGVWLSVLQGLAVRKADRLLVAALPGSEDVVIGVLDGLRHREQPVREGGPQIELRQGPR